MNNPTSPNTTIHQPQLSREQREEALSQKGAVLWLTGLSGSGKSTLAYAAEASLVRRGRFAVVLDGDNLRHGLCGDLGFSEADRTENMRRVAEVAALLADASILTFVSLVSPFAEDRERARRRIGGHRFFEVHVATPLALCEQRDPKGLYARARAGQISNMTGVDAPYEAPQSPALRLSAEEPLAMQVKALLALVGFDSV